MTDNEAENGPPDSTVENLTRDPDETGIGLDDAMFMPEDERLAQLEADNADLKDRILRVMAEMENLRRRTAKEIRDANQYGITSFARDIVSVSDNLHRALEAVPKDMAENADETLKTLLEGVGMTEREMLNVLDKHGIKRVDPTGEKFDPNFHQAMFEVPNPEVPNGTVVQLMQPGYTIGERVLRPAMVGVAKGGPKAPKQSPGQDDAGSADPSEGGLGDDNVSSGIHVNKTA